MPSVNGSTRSLLPYSSSLSFKWIGGMIAPSQGFSTGVTSAQERIDGTLLSASGIALDVSQGFYYVANGPRIDKINLTSGVYVGSIGNLMSSTGTCPQTGAATSWCTGGRFTTGTGDGEFEENTAKSLAVDSSNGFLYVLDQGNHRLTKVNLATGAYIGSIGKTTSSTGTCPSGAVTAGWCAGGTFTSGLADGAFQLDSYSGIAVDDLAGFLYVIDSGNHRVVKINSSSGAFVGATGYTTASTGTCPNSGATSVWCTGGTFRSNQAGDGSFYQAAGIALDTTNGFFYVSNMTRHTVDKFNLATGAFIGAIGFMQTSSGTCPSGAVATGWCTGGTTTFSTTPVLDGRLSSPAGIAVDPVHNLLYVANSYRLSKFTLSTGAFLGSIGKTSASTGTCPVLGLTTAWCTGGTFVTGTEDGAYNNSPLAIDPVSQTLYQTAYTSVSKVNAATGVFTGKNGGYAGVATTWNSISYPAIAPRAGSDEGAFSSAEGMYVDSVNGFIYASDANSNRVSKYNLATGAFVGSIGRLTASTGTCPSSGAATTWCTGGTFSSGAADGMFDYPTSIDADVAQNILYVADSSNARIQKFRLSTGAFLGAVGNLTSSTGTCPASGATTSWCTGGTFTSGDGDGQLDWPSSVKADPANGFLYIVDSGNYRIAKYNLTTGAFIGAIGNLIASTGSCPSSGAATSWCTGGSFDSGDQDGMFDVVSGIGLDVTNGFFYVTDYYKLSRFVLSTGASAGSIGNLSATTGTCPASGAASGWCTGGTFSSGIADGMFSGLWGEIGIDAKGFIYVSDASKGRIVAIESKTGQFWGAIGNVTASTGTCPTSGATPTWCKGGTFDIGFALGMFRYAYAMSFDVLSGYLYISDSGNRRIVKVMP